MGRWVNGLIVGACLIAPSVCVGAHARLRVAVLPFADRDEEPVLGQVAANLLSWTLELNPSIEVVPLSETIRLADQASCPYLRTTPADTQLAALARQARAHAVLYGQFSYKKKRWVTGWLFDAAQGRTVSRASAEAEDWYYMRIALTHTVPMALSPALRPVVRVTDGLPGGRIELSAGRSSGLLRYTRLRSLDTAGPVTIEIDWTWQDRATARVVAGRAGSVRNGALFQVIVPAR